jgi:predicted dehydrogenase
MGVSEKTWSYIDPACVPQLVMDSIPGPKSLEYHARASRLMKGYTYHKEQVVAALQAGKQVYCDKPLCMNIAEADESTAILLTGQVTHHIALHNRFFPATLRAKEMIEDGFLGEILSLRASYLHSGSVDRTVPLKWKLNPEFSGSRVLFDLGTHLLDLIQHFVGRRTILDCATHVAYAERLTTADPARRIRVIGEDAVIMTGCKDAKRRSGTH